MALANVAFLAAMNGHKVLVMDWDLEAPGLGYYFRGLMEASEAKAFKTSQGILDLAWEWVTNVRALKEGDELGSFIDGFLSGKCFQEAVCPLLDSEMLPGEAQLDILRAGRDVIVDPAPRSYEEALSELSWVDFFRADAGGIMLSSLRAWAKRSYDIILIDSRTGLADVAGICTMQLPDDVALCFILNRQNMEGVAKISAAVRAKRAEEVKLRAIPMRIARENTPEENDARARARKEFTTVGGFSPEAFDLDFKELAISAAPNVPFYETLAPLVASDPMKDQLSLNYLRLSSSLLGSDQEMPDFDLDWLERVRRRLQPRHATADYLLGLRTSVPERAFGEIAHLIDAALDAEGAHDGELDDDYLEALLQTAFEISDQHDEPLDTIEMLEHTVDLLRMLAIARPVRWRARLVDGITRLLESGGFLDTEDELALLEEIDSLLLDDPTYAARLQRLRHRRRAARLFIYDGNHEAAFQTIAEITELVGKLLKGELASDQLAAVQVAEIELPLLRGDIYLATEDSLARALHEFRQGLGLLASLDSSNDRPDLIRLRFDFHQRLATRFNDLVPSYERAQHALEAVRASGTGIIVFAMFGHLARPILEHRDPALLTPFIEFFYAGERSAAFANYSGRQPRTAAVFFQISAEILEALSASPSSAEVTESVSRIAAVVTRMIIRRRATMSSSQKEPLRAGIAAFTNALTRNHAYSPAMVELDELSRLLSLKVDRRARKQND